MKDQIESDWTSWFNQRFGSGITRRNTSIYTPIVANLTIPVQLYNNGTVNPPNVVRTYPHVHPNAEPLRNEDISYTSTSNNPFYAIDTNPNYAGDGFYFPRYQSKGLLYDYPEWRSTIPTRLNAPANRREFPVELRRRLY